MASSSSFLTQFLVSEGDLLEVKVGVGIFSPSHWGVYIGQQKVIHLVGLPNDRFACTSQDNLFTISGKSFRNAEVRMDDFSTFVGSQNTVKINNNLDNSERPLPASDILRKARSKIGRIDYSPQTNTCENFAKWCRYGDYNNDLGMENLATGIVAGLAGLAIGLGAYGLYKAFSGDKKEESEDDDKCSDVATSSNRDGNQGRMTALSSKSRYKEKEDRYFGRFHCNKCNYQWDSSNVYTMPGTKKVKYGQKCMRCNGDFIKPYQLQLMTCSMCDCSPCKCTCEDCGKLKHKPPQEKMPSFGYGYLDEHYCSCKKRRNYLGDHIDPRKPHPSDYCQRCQRGLYCSRHPRGL